MTTDTKVGVFVGAIATMLLLGFAAIVSAYQTVTPVGDIEDSGITTAGGELTGDLTLDDDVNLGWGDPDAVCQYDTAVTPDAMVCSVGSDSRVWYFCDSADIGTDWAKSQQTNPTLCIQSADETAVTDRICLAHNQTDAIISSDSGSIILDAASGVVSVEGASLGIRTETPAYGLHINGTNSTAGIAFTNSQNTVGKQGMRISFDTDAMGWQRAADDGTFEATYLILEQDTGELGIGGVFPASLLSVTSGLGVGATYAAGTTAPASGAIIEGTVGIGVSAPTGKLDLGGHLFVRGDVTSSAPTAGDGLDIYADSNRVYIKGYDYSSPGYKEIRMEPGALKVNPYGTPLATFDLYKLSIYGAVAQKVETINDTDATMGYAGHYAVYTALTASRTLTIPDNACNAANDAGTTYTIVDGAGAAAAWNIVVDPEGAATVNGAASYSIATNNGAVTIVCLTTDTWIITNVYP